MNKAPTQVADHGSFIRKREDPLFPEVEKYLALHALGAPVVRLLDVVEEGDGRFLVLEKALPSGLDTRKVDDFARVASFLADFASVTPPSFPEVNWDYLQHHWEVTTRLLALAVEQGSSIYDARLTECDAPEQVFEAYRQSAQGTPRALTHGDPADANLGVVGGKLVAFDLQLSWIGDPFRVLALRTGASVMPFPPGLLVDRVLETFQLRTGLEMPDAKSCYQVAGAIYGTYFEAAALQELMVHGRAARSHAWALLVIERYVHFTRGLALG